MTIAALGIEASTKGVAKSVAELEELTIAARHAGDAAKNLVPPTERAGEAAADLGDQVEQTEGSLQRFAKQAGTVVGALAAMAAGALSVGSYVRMADAWSDMRSKIGAAIGDMGAANDMMARMTEIANASYSSLSQTVEVYSRNVGALGDMGRSADEAADFTESLNHMLVITATKGERAASVQNALSRAMALGRLQADGLETVLSSGGRVAEALAKELNTTVSGLRALASEGKITGQVIANSIIKQLEEVRKVAGDMPATVADGFTRITTGLTALVGSFDQAFGISGALAKQLVAVGDALKSLADTDFESWVGTVVGALEGLAQIAVILAATQIPALVLAINGVAIGTSLGTAAAWLYVGALNAVALAMRAVALLGGPIGVALGVTAAIGLAFYNNNRRINDLTEATKLSAIAQNELNSAMERFYDNRTQANLDSAVLEAQENLKSIRAELEAAQKVSDSWIMPNFFPGLGPSFKEQQATKAAEIAHVEALRGKLMEAESVVSAMDHAALNFASRVGEGTAAVVALNSEQQKSVASANDLTASYQRRTELAKAESQFGRDSAQFMEVQLNQERAITFARIAALDITNEQKEATRAAYDQMILTEAATNGWNVKLNEVNTTLSASYQALVKIRETQPGDGWLSTAISKAAGLALTLWDAVAASGALSNISVSGPVESGVYGEVGARGDPRQFATGTSNTFDRPNFTMPEIGGGGGGGGGGGAAQVETLNSIVEALTKEQTLRQSLIGLGAEQRLEAEAYNDLVGRMKSSGAEYTEEALRGAAAQIAAQRLLTETMEEQQATQDRVAKGLASLFKAGLQGAEAFKNALSGLLSRLADMLINSAFRSLVGGMGPRATNLLGSLFPNADGNAFSGGNVIPFANGGIVSSPTTFPMRGGAGLMGEAGPEAIMPLARGRDGKLGVKAAGGGGGAGGGGVLQISLGAGLQAEWLEEAKGQSVQITQAGIAQNNKGMPEMVKAISARPRVR